jgi:THO complex subunit 4
MQIEVVVDASRVQDTPAKSLADRVAYANSKSTKGPLTASSANPKAQPKSATSTKANTKDAKGKKTNPRTKKGKSNKPKAKTAEELDAEMTDYWGNNAGANNTDAATNGAAPAAAGDDLGMDEISVSSIEFVI